MMVINVSFQVGILCKAIDFLFLKSLLEENLTRGKGITVD